MAAAVGGSTVEERESVDSDGCCALEPARTFLNLMTNSRSLMVTLTGEEAMAFQGMWRVSSRIRPLVNSKGT